MTYQRGHRRERVHDADRELATLLDGIGKKVDQRCLRVHGEKMQLTTIPDAEWATVESAAREFWDEIAAQSETKAKVVEIFKQYNADMEKAGRPYRYT